MEENIIRLAEPKKKTFLHLIFSRFFLFVILLILQVLLVISFYAWLRDLLPHFMAFMMLFLVAGVIYLFNSSMDSSAKLTWMFIIAIMPFSGVALLVFTRTNIGHRAIRQRVQMLTEETSGAIVQSESVLKELDRDPAGTDDLDRYLNRSGCFPVYDRTKTTFFPLGEDMFAAMLEELKKAEEFIFMEFFIIDEGLMWGSILKILAEKAAAGVEVRVMYDGMLEVSTLPPDYCGRLQKLGIRAKAFSPQ